ncbi:MAG: ATP synthase F1 subunit gamma [Firmicutes bacterium]|nr:ATP synthase F1 subunit gamma [Bacillota bacterium]
MAVSMQDVKRRIKSVTSMEHITNAMKLVSAAKLRRAKATFEQTNKQLHFITDTIGEIFTSTTNIPEEYLEGNREIKNTCYIILTSSKGLCGGFNSNVIRKAEESMAVRKSAAKVVAVGSKGRDYFAKEGIEIIGDYEDPPETISFLATQQLSRPIIKMYEDGEIDEVVLVYTAYLSTLDQQATAIRMLPFKPETNNNVMMHDKDIEYGPSMEAVFNYLVPKYVETMVYNAIVESATCEHAARRMAMENATDNARDMLQELSLNYNRARQAAITNQLIEIVSGSEAQK